MPIDEFSMGSLNRQLYLFCKVIKLISTPQSLFMLTCINFLRLLVAGTVFGKCILYR